MTVSKAGWYKIETVPASAVGMVQCLGSSVDGNALDNCAGDCRLRERWGRGVEGGEGSRRGAGVGRESWGETDLSHRLMKLIKNEHHHELSCVIYRASFSLGPTCFFLHQIETENGRNCRKSYTEGNYLWQGMVLVGLVGWDPKVDCKHKMKVWSDDALTFEIRFGTKD